MSKATLNTLNKILHLVLMPLLIMSLTGKASANEVTIEAEHLLANKTQGLSTYTGNVIVKDEEITLWADTVDVYFDKNNQIQKMVAQGNQTKFHSKQNNQLTEGFADKVLYFPDDERAELIGQAKLSQQESTISGAHIKANLKTEKIEALSNTTQKRIKTTFQPTSK